jgi:RNA polymerase sigma-70 factor (family 1)
MVVSSTLQENFKQLFFKEYNSLCNYAYTILSDRTDAEDIVQDTFIKLWEKRPELSQQANQAKYYLITAVKNNCISFLRKKNNRPTIAIEENTLQTLPSSLNTLQEHERYALLLQQALDQLPPQCQHIFRLSRFGQLTYQQIANEMELSVKTVENQMGKALKILRAFLKAYQLPLLLIWLSQN